eukprot:CAMPEP_0206608776 /NCGR_PEP_ID=MMETSP0325_2-20121206/53282_1 /ASSEMBLY_ACC=CAM_ASM_000347 /TAXON_ID=2866 /ORGANISM="Crypthecodinium cohnii, Strain Seligo" /LENGTH=124 /DNA_ID=CAMNT_0054126715 /DNA_START=667 /DNA_END=1040 /DNA_ORIENTATION=+
MTTLKGDPHVEVPEHTSTKAGTEGISLMQRKSRRKVLTLTRRRGDLEFGWTNTQIGAGMTTKAEPTRVLDLLHGAGFEAARAAAQHEREHGTARRAAQQDLVKWVGGGWVSECFFLLQLSAEVG